MRDAYCTQATPWRPHKYQNELPPAEERGTKRLFIAKAAGPLQDEHMFNHRKPQLMTTSNSSSNIRRDTRAWKLQVWVSFTIATVLCGTGLAWLPGTDLDLAFMVMGYIFCVSTAFALAKYIRDHQDGRMDTPMWSLVVWSGFSVAMFLTAWGLWRMSIQPVWKAYLLVCWLFLISSVFTLAKTLRDAYEADLIEAQQTPVGVQE
jgi:hypothetical protein